MGHFSVSSCTICSPGFGGVIVDSGSVCSRGCSRCSPGTYSSSNGNTCLSCPVGTFSLSGNATCSNCPAGTYGSTTGLSSNVCTGSIVCPAGKYALSGASSSDLSLSTVCATCPSGTISVSGSTSSSACKASETKTESTPSTIPVTPSTPTTPTVEVGISFANVDPVIFTSPSTRKNIEAAFAKAAGVDVSKVEITSITNKLTGAKIYPARRRLQVATVEVISRIIVADSAAASKLSDTILLTKDNFAATVITDLKTTEASNFQAVTATVSTVTVVNPPPAAETKAGLSTGEIIGIVIGVIAALAIGVVSMYLRGRQAKIDTDPEADTKAMYNNPMPKKTAKVQSSV